MAAIVRIGDGVKIPDGRIARMLRKTSKTHQRLIFPVDQLKLGDCPKEWMRREDYNRSLKIMVAKMKKRFAARERSKK